MNYSHFVGADISKPFIDFVIVDSEGKKVFYQKVDNTQKDFNTFLKTLKKQGLILGECLFCMENTGIYNEHLLTTLHEHNLDIWLEKAIQIKQSIGVQRGKNDKIDAYRIAIYALKHQMDLKLWKPEREVIKQLKQYTTLRNRLISAKNQLASPLKEIELFADKKHSKSLQKHCENSITALKEDIKQVDKTLDAIIKNDSYLNGLFNIISSVDGVGKIVARQFIIDTGEFKRISDPRKFACYAGVVPFEHSSGISVRGKARVSPFANKNMKRLLHMSAIVNIKIEGGDLKKYYDRKVEEGKNKMSVINALRNKIVARVFACVSNGEIYQRDYLSQNKTNLQTQTVNTND